MVRLGDGTDSFGVIFGLSGGHGAWPQLGGWIEQRAAQILELAQPGGGHGEATPAAGGPVEHGPDQGEAAGLAGEPADDLDPADLHQLWAGWRLQVLGVEDRLTSACIPAGILASVFRHRG